VERLLAYGENLPQEAPSIIPHSRPPPGWPSTGAVEFRNVTMKYDTSEEIVLKNITCSIADKEKIGIVGRTGAGKSTFTLALFRILELHDGQIFLDKVDISKIGLKDLRSQLAIIPQDPVLFLGTVRSNLDPWNKHSDFTVWQTLEKVHMKSVIEDLSGLETNVEEGGINFSVGQRQLLCIARALLQSCKILLLDEATASIDIETDNLIQKTIREAFLEQTTITIAHRLHTIIDCDKIIVLDQGKIVEFGTPHELLSNPDSYFLKMVNESDSAEQLKLIAAQTHKKGKLQSVNLMQ